MGFVTLVEQASSFNSLRAGLKLHTNLSNTSERQQIIIFTEMYNKPVNQNEPFCILVLYLLLYFATLFSFVAEINSSALKKKVLVLDLNGGL